MFSRRINIGAKIVDAGHRTQPPLEPSDRSLVSRQACRFSNNLCARAQSRGGRLVTVVSVGRNCVLAAQMRYALSTFIWTCPPPFVPVAVGTVTLNRRCFGLVPGFAWYGNFSRYETAVSHERPHDYSLFPSSPVHATYGTYCITRDPGDA